MSFHERVVIGRLKTHMPRDEERPLLQAEQPWEVTFRWASRTAGVTAQWPSSELRCEHSGAPDLQLSPFGPRTLKHLASHGQEAKEDLL